MELDNNILDKIVNLLKLAEKNNNVNESAAAASAAQALLSKHRLTLADLASHKPEQKEAPGVDKTALISGNRIAQWRSDLICAVTKANGCRYYYSRTFQRMGHGDYRSRREYLVSVKLIGRPSDITVVRYFYAYLEREIERLSAVALAGNCIKGKKGGNSFKMGASLAVALRLNESTQNSRVEAQTATCTALVHLDAADKETEEFYNNFSKGFREHQRSQVSISGDAWEQGRKAGSGIALNKGLEGHEIKQMAG